MKRLTAILLTCTLIASPLHAYAETESNEAMPVSLNTSEDNGVGEGTSGENDNTAGGENENSGENGENGNNSESGTSAETGESSFEGEGSGSQNDENAEGSSQGGSENTEGSSETGAAEENADSSEGKTSEEGSESGKDDENNADDKSSDADKTGETNENTDNLTPETEEKTDENAEETTNPEGNETENSDVTDPEAAALMPEQEVAPDESKIVTGKAFSYEEEIEGYHVALSCEENIIPDGAYAKVKLLSESEEKKYKNRIREASNTSLLDATFFDITLYDAENNIIQPQNGEMHVSIGLSEEISYDLMQYGDSVNVQLFHFHDDNMAEIEAEESYEETDVVIEKDADEEVYVDEENVDIETGELLVSMDEGVLMADNDYDEEYLQKLTLDFDVDGFSVFGVATMNVFETPYSMDGNTAVYDLTGNAELASNFRGVVQDCLYGPDTEDDSEPAVKVIIPPGIYSLSGGLFIDCNTTLEMTGATIVNAGGSDPMIRMQGYGSAGVGKFDDYRNITISGGTFDGEGLGESIIKIGHLTGLTIQNVTFEDSSSPHMLEIAAAKDVKVIGCTFQNSRHPDGELEAFQIDGFNKKAFSYSVDPIYDDYCCTNVEVSGCTFRNLKRGFGSHLAVAGPFYMENIQVHDNVFENIMSNCITASKWRNSAVYNNTMNNIGIGVNTTMYPWHTQYPTDKSLSDESCLAYNANISITGNIINIGGSDRSDGVYVGVLVRGYNSTNKTKDYPKGTFKPTGYTVANNIITGYSDWNTYNRDNNYAGICQAYSKGMTATGNTFKSGEYGVWVTNGAEASLLNSNKFDSPRAASIAVTGKSVVSNMDDNALAINCPFGIYVEDGSSCSGKCKLSGWNMGAGEKYSLSGAKFSLFTNDLSNRIPGKCKSSKKAVATVSKDGVVAGKKKGKAKITAKWNNGDGTVQVVINVNVKKAPSKIKNVKSKITIKKGETYQLEPKTNTACLNYTYKSSKKKVATVSEYGLITAKKKGKTTITIKTYNGKTKKVTVTVK